MRFALELLACTLFYLLGMRYGTTLLRSRIRNWITNRNIELNHGMANAESMLQSLAKLLRE